MSLQGITVAISPSGASYFADILLANQIASRLKNISVPSKTISVGDITLSSSKGGSTIAHDIKINLQSGSLSGFDPTFTSLTQGDGGQFTMILTAKNFVVNYKWNETYDEQLCSIIGCHTFQHENNTYDYSVGIGAMTITIVFKFEYANSAWALTLVSATPDSSNLTPNIPSDSIVNSEEYAGCFKTSVSDTTKSAVDTIDFSGAINTAVTPAFGSIPSTGQLTSDISFNFPMGPSGLTFPNNSGIATGVTGDTTYGTTEYPGTNPPQLALPPIPANNHLQYYASDYTFNSLFWAFFEAGLLVATASPSNVPDPAALNTANYKNTPLQALYDAYPNAGMTAKITALAAPTVTFASIYDLTAANLPNLKSQLPDSVYTSLQAISGQVYMNEAAFFQALQQTLGQAAADQYKTIIEGVALVVGAVVTHSIQVVLNVISGGSAIPVIIFDVTETDVLQGFALGIAGTTQTLQFQFQIVQPLTTATFVSSTIPGINSGDWGFIYNWVLQPVFATEVAKMGQNGVALPRINGFDFLFKNATITLQPGYAAVLADVQYTSDSGVAYMASKRVIAAAAHA